MQFNRSTRGFGIGDATAQAATSPNPYQTALATGMSDATAQMYLPFPQNATACEAARYYTKDPSGKFLINSSLVPGGIMLAGIAALAYNHPIIGAILIAVGLNELPVWGCSTVAPGNSCPGYTECNSFICRNGGCGF